jgi:tRNA(fMet)-specific endonuclease VapC
MIVLDSDILTLWTYDHKTVRERYDAVPHEETIGITAITRMEVLGGRTASVLKAADEEELRKAAKRLQQVEKMLEDFQVLHVDEAAIRHFETLRVNKKTRKMGRADMLIACIALAHDALLVTRNLKDYKDVPGLRTENWAAKG